MGAWLQIGGALSAETIAGCGFDTVVIDLQHSLIDFSTCAAMLLAIEKQGVEPICADALERARRDHEAASTRAPTGVVAPMIETAEEAAPSPIAALSAQRQALVGARAGR